MSHRSSDCLVITIMELPEESPSSDSLSMLNVVGLYRPPSLDSLPCNLPAQKCHTWTSRSFPRCLLGALCLVSTYKTSQTSQHWSDQSTPVKCKNQSALVGPVKNQSTLVRPVNTSQISQGCF